MEYVLLLFVVCLDVKNERNVGFDDDKQMLRSWNELPMVQKVAFHIKRKSRHFCIYNDPRAAVEDEGGG